MALTAKLWTISAIAVELRMDKRTIGEIITEAGILSHKKKQSRYEYYYIADVVNAWMGRSGLDLTQERAQLAKEQTRRLQRENNIEERKVIPASEMVDILQVVSKQIVSILEALPLNIKRKVPMLKAKDIEYVKLEIAKCRNACGGIKVREGKNGYEISTDNV